MAGYVVVDVAVVAVAVLVDSDCPCRRPIISRMMGEVDRTVAISIYHVDFQVELAPIQWRKS